MRTTKSGRQAGKNIENLIQAYIGLSDAQIDVATRVPTNFAKAPKNVRDALIARRLYTSNGKSTKLGSSIFKVYFDIIAGKFVPPEGVLKNDEAAVLNDPQKIARQKRVKDLGLRSEHIKFMRVLLSKPGLSIFALEKIFSVHIFSELITRGLASRHQESHQIFPTERGTSFMKECIAEVSSKGEWAWVCRNCKRKYPENGDGLSEGQNAMGRPSKLCECGGVVDLSATKQKGNKDGNKNK